MESDLRILCVNDVYKPERFSVLKTLTGLHQGSGVTKLVLPGDFLGGSMFAAAHQGMSVVDVLNHLDVDYFTLGNHEFDFGSQRVEELMDKSNFKWLGSNVRYTESRALFKSVVDYDVFNVKKGAQVKASDLSSGSNSHPDPIEVDDDGGVKNSEAAPVRVGVFGVCTESTPLLSDPGEDVIFENVLMHAKRCVAALKQKNCDFIIALTHMELDCDKLIAEQLDIDLIIGGHEHTPFFIVHSGTTIIKCGQNLDHLGILDLSFSRNEVNEIKTIFSFKLLSTADTATNETIDSVIHKWISSIPEEEGAGEILCTVGDTPLSTLSSDLRGRETAFACMVADAICHSYSEQGCQLGIQNGGFIRQDLVYKPSAILTKSTITDEMPFPRIPTLLKMSLGDIILGLEQMLSGAPAAVGSFPHLSRDWVVQYDLTKLPLQRIQSVSYQKKKFDVMNDEDTSMKFLVGISDFYIGKDGDGVEVFSEQEVVSDHKRLISGCVVEYLRTCVTTLSGDAPGRLVNITLCS